MLVSCPDCGTSVRKEDAEEAAETIENHNEERHDGEQVAGIGPNAMSLPEFSEEEKEEIQAAVERLKEAENDDH